MEQTPIFPDLSRTPSSVPACRSEPSLPHSHSAAYRSSPEIHEDEQYENSSIAIRPTFNQWIKLIWPDLLTVALLGGAVLPVFLFVPPVGVRVFPLGITTPDTVKNTSAFVSHALAYPARPQIFSSWVVAVGAIGVPVTIILLLQFWIRSFWDAHNGILGLVYSLVVSASFGAVIKALVGGFRPTFYDICIPDQAYARGAGNKTGLNGVGFGEHMWSTDVCTADHNYLFRDSMRSFPSGHSTTSVAAGVYLLVYLNARLKTFGSRQAPLWKLVMVSLPVLVAVIMCGALVIDNSHNWYDIIAGATIGMLFSIAGYRMVFSGIFDWRVNHIPLIPTWSLEAYPKPDAQLPACAPVQGLQSNKTTSLIN
ncbi:PAP2 superfamily-domain-containing protein [Xylariaceae sp. FL0255]|nr:PAP2 superfamily-domain-containing protein [Xylariaceae sp. FL0255]